MLNQPKNRYVAAARIFISNPLTSTRFMIDDLLGRSSRHRFKFGDIELTIRTQSPDLRVVRSCLLGEFEEAMAVTSANARFIIDAGGYIGLVSILLAKRFPMAQVVCLEPSSENFALACENCRPYPNITVQNVALGTRTGRSLLHDRGTGPWGFSIVSLEESKEVQPESIEMVTIPDLAKQFGIDEIDFLKLDIEGAEYEIFEVAETWIDRCDVLIVELHERIRPGTEELYGRVIAHRKEIVRTAEKRLSVSPRFRRDDL